MSSDFERADDVRMDVGALFAALLSRALRIVLVTVLLLVATAVILLFVPKSYESSTSLLVEPRNNIYTRAAIEAPSSGSAVNTEALMSSQVELIKSRDLLLEVVDSQNLRSVPEFANAGFSPLGLLLRLIGRGPEPRSVDETVLGNLADRLTVIRERDSAVISIHVRSSDPELAARIANAIAAGHVKRRAAQSLADTADATVWLRQEIDKLRTEVKAAETAVANYKVDNDLYVGSNNVSVTDQQLSVVTTQIAEAQQRKNDAESRSKVIRGMIASGQSLDGVNDVRNSVVIQSLLQTKANLQADLAQKSTTLLSNHPTIKALKAQIGELTRQVAAEAARVADALDAEAKVEAGLEQRLRDDLSRAKLTAGDATKGSVTLDGLAREAKTQRDLLESYLAKYSDATSRTASNAALPDVRIVSEAAPSVEPAAPKIPLILGAVGFVALALQGGAVLMGELMSGRVLVERQRVADVEAADERYEAEAPPPFSGNDDIDDELEQAVESSLAPAPRPAAADELAQLSAAVSAHQLRTVLLASLDGGAEPLMVIDRLLEDALMAGLSAVVVDAGSGEPSAAPGLTDLAAEHADYGDVMQRAGDNLAEVPWGRLDALDRRSSRPLTMVEALADIYHVVIVDTGRVGLASNLPLFSGARASVVLVASSDSNPVAVGAARRDIAALGFEVGRVVSLPTARANVA
ncbi:GumC family protein [Devosia sp. A16]|uniref:GumC family protein n=1 Tax=Devosia sp. A16 TaxID=1736675 RepID=UPI0006D7D976|nr:GumC family protein [Devosia sp. A16]